METVTRGSRETLTMWFSLDASALEDTEVLAALRREAAQPKPRIFPRPRPPGHLAPHLNRPAACPNIPVCFHAGSPAVPLGLPDTMYERDDGTDIRPERLARLGLSVSTPGDGAAVRGGTLT